METVKLLDASPKGTVDFEFEIDARYANINGVMHGGAAGVIFDMCTTTALGPLAKPGFWESVPPSISRLTSDPSQLPWWRNQDLEYQLSQSDTSRYITLYPLYFPS